jgi:hypothetical protein
MGSTLELHKLQLLTILPFSHKGDFAFYMSDLLGIIPDTTTHKL